MYYSYKPNKDGTATPVARPKTGDNPYVTDRRGPQPLMRRSLFDANSTELVDGPEERDNFSTSMQRLYRDQEGHKVTQSERKSDPKLNSWGADLDRREKYWSAVYKDNPDYAKMSNGVFETDRNTASGGSDRTTSTPMNRGDMGTLYPPWKGTEDRGHRRDDMKIPSTEPVKSQVGGASAKPQKPEVDAGVAGENQNVRSPAEIAKALDEELANLREFHSDLQKRQLALEQAENDLKRSENVLLSEKNEFRIHKLKTQSKVDPRDGDLTRQMKDDYRDLPDYDAQQRRNVTFKEDVISSGPPDHGRDRTDGMGQDAAQSQDMGDHLAARHQRRANNPSRRRSAMDMLHVSFKDDNENDYSVLLGDQGDTVPGQVSFPKGQPLPSWDGLDWDTYVLQSKALADMYNWNENLFAKALVAGVSKKAPELVLGSRGKSLSEIIKHVNDYHTGLTTIERRKRLWKYVKPTEMSPIEYSTAIIHRGYVAYGDEFRFHIVEAIEMFKDNLGDPEMSAYVAQANPKTLHEAAESAMNYLEGEKYRMASTQLNRSVSAINATDGTKKKKKWANRLNAIEGYDFSDEDVGDDMEDVFVSEVKALRRDFKQRMKPFGGGRPNKPLEVSEKKPIMETKADRPLRYRRPLSEIVCFLCGGTGHYVTKCPEIAKASELLKKQKPEGK